MYLAHMEIDTGITFRSWPPSKYSAAAFPLVPFLNRPKNDPTHVDNNKLQMIIV